MLRRIDYLVVQVEVSLFLLAALVGHCLPMPAPQLKIPFPRRGSPPNSRGDYSFSFSNSEQRSRQARQEAGVSSEH